MNLTDREGQLRHYPSARQGSGPRLASFGCRLLSFPERGAQRSLPLPVNYPAQQPVGLAVQQIPFRAPHPDAGCANGQTLFELCARLTTKHGVGSTRQAISQHLDVLEEAGLVRTRRDGRYKFHFIDTSPLRAIVDRWPPQD